MGAQGLTATLVYTYNADGLRVAQQVTGEVTEFAGGWATGVPEMLSEGGNLYLVGHETLGRWDGSVWAYYLPDALGSVRQVADGEGEVVDVREWTPYGVEVGAAQAGLGYTGEWWDSYIRFTYLRARWYGNQMGRFTSPEPIVLDFRNPQSINDYVYVLDNPVNYADSSGLCPDSNGICTGSGPDPRDLTGWLYREMVHNINDPIIRNLRAWNTIAKGWGGVGIVACGVGFAAGQPIIVVGGGVVIVGGMVPEGTALYEFAQQVKNGARWDFKDEIGRKLGPGITLCSPGTCYNDVEYSVPGNVYFAYIGGAAGFFDVEIQAGAAWAEVHDPAHDPASPEHVDPYEGVVDFGPTWWDPSTWNLGDEPMDHDAVTLGIKLWEKYGAGITRTQFEAELAGYISRLARHAPRTRPVELDVARDWPYPVGYFNNRGNPYNPSQEMP